jgi:hypothetical protein
VFPVHVGRSAATKTLILSLALLAFGVFAGCGGGGDAARVDECFQGFRDSFEKASPEAKAAVPVQSMEAAAQRICEEAVARDLLDDEDSQADVERKLAGLIAENPEVLYPACVGAALKEFETLEPSEQSAELRAEFRAFGRNYCDVAIEKGYVRLGRQPTQEEIDELLRSNPELVVPICLVSALQTVERDPIVIEGKRVSRAKAEVLFRRVCTEASRRGLFSGGGDEVTPAQARAIERLSARITRQMIRAGELP